MDMHSGEYLSAMDESQSDRYEDRYDWRGEDGVEWWNDVPPFAATQADVEDAIRRAASDNADDILPCGHLEGTGCDCNDEPPCPWCGGAGYGGVADSFGTGCPACNGTGHTTPYVPPQPDPELDAAYAAYVAEHGNEWF
jgi:hypothetical protein